VGSSLPVSGADQQDSPVIRKLSATGSTPVVQRILRHSSRIDDNPLDSRKIR
jgi:hypothetical protein